MSQEQENERKQTQNPQDSSQANTSDLNVNQEPQGNAVQPKGTTPSINPQSPADDRSQNLGSTRKSSELDDADEE